MNDFSVMGEHTIYLTISLGSRSSFYSIVNFDVFHSAHMKQGFDCIIPKYKFKLPNQENI